MLQQARWVDQHTIALPYYIDPNQAYRLIYEPGRDGLPLTGIGEKNGFHQFHLPDSVTTEDVKSMVKGQLAVVGSDAYFRTGLQLAGVLDELFYFDGKLGPQFPEDPHENICVSVWAPTARVVELLLFQNADDKKPAATLPMIEANGVWSVEIESSWKNRYYLFSVTVCIPKLEAMVENIVTDPYSTDLALNGTKSRLTDLNDAATKPDGWNAHASPELAAVNDLSIWELHVRDFSMSDLSVPAEQRGTYLAFTHAESNAMKHLKSLADAGLTAVHLLPTFHIGSINEDKSTWKTPGDLSIYPPDGTQQQEAIAAIQNLDGFNWGYDPVHFMAPAGAYAMDPDSRVKEYRQMVQALHASGLLVIQDLVFNHTCSSGQAKNSVLDKIVPDYYYRLNAEGNIMNGSCCSDTASEHKMMEKLMIDTVVQNVHQYKIDGYRFDLMSYHFASNMRKLRAALDPKIYIYGEGWPAGETDNWPDMPNATQHNLFGTGIGTFNDRVRDAIRGGGPFSDQRAQGFASGYATDMNESDLIRASLAGSLRDYSFTTSQGQTTQAGWLTYNGQAAGYASTPAECVNFCSCHDNQTLFDAIQMKAPANEDTRTRARRNVLAMGLIALSQGIPFFHAGDEILRSKDMDRNSYNSGDWFNKLDFTYQTNNWGIGLPLASENQNNWPIMQPLLANPALKPNTEDILFTRDAFEALLRVRYSSTLFRMRTLAEVQSNLHFIPSDPGVIAMQLNANLGQHSGFKKLLVVYNGNAGEAELRSAPVIPHPEMRDNGYYDGESGCVCVPGLTTAVFVGG